MYLENKYQDSVTLEHDMKVNGVTLVESWLKESATKDKSNLYNLNVPVGSWIGTFRITNPTLKEKFRKGELRAVSIEGIFEHLEKTDRTDTNKFMNNWSEVLHKDVEELSEQESELLLGKIKAVISKDKRYKKNQRIDFESYSDYGERVRGNAKNAVEWAEENGWGSCGTAVGKQRASQLAKGEPISVETIKRMYSYLSRHEGDLESSTSYNDGCGKLMYDSWGGKAGLSWSRNKLRELGLLEENELPQITSSYPGEASGSYKSPEVLVELPELDVFGYETTHFYMCPSAVKTFQALLKEEDLDEGTIDMGRAAAVIADTLFMIEDRVIKEEEASESDVRRAEVLVSMFKDVFLSINERVGYGFWTDWVNGHLEVIKSFYNVRETE